MKSVPFTVWRLMIAYSLMMGGTALTVLIAGIIGVDFAPSTDLATLPVALAVVGVASSTLPTGRLQASFGRRKVFIAYGMLAILSALVCAGALLIDSFALYCFGTFLMGWAAAAGHQYRFAALELVPATHAPQATSVLLLGGIVGAFVGPELAVRGRNLFAVEYVGSYLLLVGAYVLGLCIVWFYREARVESGPGDGGGRPVGEIMGNPVVILAIAASATAYGVMTFLMTATPISMHEHAGHSLEATKWVIQSHIAGMYVPSLFFGVLLARFGFRVMMWTGVLAFGLTLVAGYLDTAVMNFWSSMVLLGIGWNFLFLAGTNMLPQGYRQEERFKIQSFNDFLTFSVQAMVAFGSGWFLHRFGWEGVIQAGLVPVLLFMLLLWRSGAFRMLKTDQKSHPLAAGDA